VHGVWADPVSGERGVMFEVKMAGRACDLTSQYGVFYHLGHFNNLVTFV
jgi:hypothetical protein